MLDLTAPAINQLKGEDAKSLVSFYMNTQGLVKAHEWSAENASEIKVAAPQPNALNTSAPSMGGAGSAPKRTPQTVAEVTTTEGGE